MSRSAELNYRIIFLGCRAEPKLCRIRSPEELRRAVEQLMISAGDRNADVRASIHAGHTDQSNIRINANIDQTDELIKRIRRDPEQFQEQ